jgi:hypothetical protein
MRNVAPNQEIFVSKCVLLEEIPPALINNNFGG